MADYNKYGDLGDEIKNAKTDAERAYYAELRQKKEDDMRANGTWNNSWQSTGEMYQPEKDPYEKYLEDSNRITQAKTDQAVNQLMSQIPGINSQYDNLAKESFVNFKMGQKNLPEQMARLGLAGSGVSETTAGNLQTNYENVLSQGERGRGEAIQGINTAAANVRASGDIASAQTAADYYLQMAQNQRDDLIRQQQQANLDREFEFNSKQNEENNKLQNAQLLASYGDFSGFRAIGYTPEQIAAMEKRYQQDMAERQAATQRSYSSRGRQPAQYKIENEDTPRKTSGFQTSIAKSAYADTVQQMESGMKIDQSFLNRNIKRMEAANVPASDIALYVESFGGVVPGLNGNSTSTVDAEIGNYYNRGTSKYDLAEMLDSYIASGKISENEAIAIAKKYGIV